jgi:hypothetical protein
VEVSTVGAFMVGAFMAVDFTTDSVDTRS